MLRTAVALVVVAGLMFLPWCFASTISERLFDTTEGSVSWMCGFLLVFGLCAFVAGAVEYLFAYPAAIVAMVSDGIHVAGFNEFPTAWLELIAAPVLVVSLPAIFLGARLASKRGWSPASPGQR